MPDKEALTRLLDYIVVQLLEKTDLSPDDVCREAEKSVSVWVNKHGCWWSFCRLWRDK
jgi:hypothetical protein